MRIAIWHNLPSGGGKRALHQQVKGLLARGHLVAAWCPTTAAVDYLSLRQLIPEHVRPLAWEEVPRRIEWGNISAGAIAGAARKLSRKWRSFDTLGRHGRTCAREIDDGGFDVLLAHPCAVMSAPYIGRYATLPRVLYLQEPNRALYEAVPVLPWKAPPPFRAGSNPVRHLCERAEDQLRIHYLRVQAREEHDNAAAFDSILVNSYFSRESTLRAYGLDATVCYLGVDTSLFRPVATVGKGAYVITVGSVNPLKNTMFLLRALRSLKRDRPALVCVANGFDPDYRDEVIRYAHDHGISIDIRVNVPDRELVELYNGALFAVYAPRLEPFGYVTLEANACRIPVVAAAEGGVRETIVDQENGLLVAPDPESMAAGIGRLVSDGRLRDVMGKQGLAEVERRWTLTQATVRLERCLLDTATGKAPGTVAHG
ncbi:MAG: glycosyltransferase family 4 protein [Candidatus Edwardsbacteria bacterium]|jgi:glycosyltransferase involved in cell wall biosynthesis|nr:glycosyltransferase family 4 protein [Candidatus Edwardsbacteria bacterium]